jgi:hypothetical protein
VSVGQLSLDNVILITSCRALSDVALVSSIKKIYTGCRKAIGDLSEKRRVKALLSKSNLTKMWKTTVGLQPCLTPRSTPESAFKKPNNSIMLVSNPTTLAKMAPSNNKLRFRHRSGLGLLFYEAWGYTVVDVLDFLAWQCKCLPQKGL